MLTAAGTVQGAETATPSLKVLGGTEGGPAPSSCMGLNR